MSTCLRLAAAVAALTGLANLSQADKIFLADGNKIEDVTVVGENLSGVTYRASGKTTELNVAADQVLRVQYEKNVPAGLSEALEVLDATGSERFGEAATQLFNYADGQLDPAREGTKKDKAWFPPYALHRAMDLAMAVGTKGANELAIKAADLVLAKCPDSRYVPHAYVVKAAAQRDLGRGQDAGATIAALKELVRTRALSDSFRLQAELIEVEIGALKGNQKRDKLIELGTQAGSGFPVVRNRARVLEAATYIEGESKDYAKARKTYETITKDPKADAGTLAAAYVGLGDCLFQEAAEKRRVNAAADEVRQVLEDSLLNYLRVAIVYPDQMRYVPKALFQSGKVFEFIGDDTKTNAKKVYAELLREYPESEWATQLRNSRK
jgi:hypothetical protein